MRRSKRKAQRAEERSGGNVIPLPRGRAEVSTAQEVRGPGREAATAEQLEPQPARAARSAEQLATHTDIDHDDDHPDIRNFFASPTKSAPPASAQWSDLEGTDHDAPPARTTHPRGMYWTVGIAGSGLLMIGAFLLYHKVLMPTPEELPSKGQIALPTPDMVKSTPERLGEPGAAEQVRMGGQNALDPSAARPASEPGSPGAQPAPGSGTPSEATPGAASGAATSSTPAPATGSGSTAPVPAGAGPAATAAVPGSGPAPAPAASSSSAAAPGSGASAAPRSTATSGAAAGPTASGANTSGSTRAPAASASGSSRAPAPTSSAHAAKAGPAGYTEALTEARKLGYRRSAEAAYLRAIEANPKGAEALSGLAMLYLNFGDNVRAKQRAEQALARDPSNAEGWIVLGASQSALGKHNEARQAYVRCAALPASKYVSECKRMLR